MSGVELDNKNHDFGPNSSSQLSETADDIELTNNDKVIVILDSDDMSEVVIDDGIVEYPPDFNNTTESSTDNSSSSSSETSETSSGSNAESTENTSNENIGEDMPFWFWIILLFVMLTTITCIVGFFLMNDTHNKVAEVGLVLFLTTLFISLLGCCFLGGFREIHRSRNRS